MKARIGFVSNSSSSSFLVSYHTIRDFDALKSEKKGYKRFIKDVLEHEDNTEEIKRFLARKFDDVVNGYYHYVTYGDNFCESSDILGEFKSLCADMNCDSEGIMKLAEKAKALVESCDPNASSSYYKGEKYEQLEHAFVESAYAAMKQYWNHMSAFSYSDDVDSYMEHEFMWDFAWSNSENFGLQIISNH